MQNLLEKEISKEFEGNAGNINFVAALVGLMVAILVGVTVVIPSVDTAIVESNITGTTKTVVQLIPIVVAVVLVLATLAMAG